jgi:acetyl esterase/lipase
LAKQKHNKSHCFHRCREPTSILAKLHSKSRSGADAGAVNRATMNTIGTFAAPAIHAAEIGVARAPQKLQPRAMLLPRLFLILALAGTPLFGPNAAAATTRTETYKVIGDVRLDLTIHLPDDWKASDRRPAIIFFFGGGWNGGAADQFTNQCRYLASRGMVAVAADYRVKSRHNVLPATCVADAKSALRWVRAHAFQIGIDPDRLAAGGGSAGGHLAAATAMLPGLDDPADDLAVSCTPNALVLFNPVLTLAPIEGLTITGFGERSTPERFGCPPEAISPTHHVRTELPPTLILHGTADTTVPLASVAVFRERMVAAGNRCELVTYQDQGHGFFNFGRRDPRIAFETLTEADRFFVSLQWLAGEPRVEAHFAAMPPSARQRQD